MKFEAGDRVKVIPYDSWPEGAFGIVAVQPDYVREALGSKAAMEGTQITIKGRDRIITCVWVEFDQPAHDGSDDGPYTAGTVDIEYLLKL
jgi:hypothetical protein